MRYTVIIINHSHGDMAKRAVESLIKNDQIDPGHIVLIDNNGDLDVNNWISAEYPSATLIKNNIRKGFAENANLGISHSNSEYVILVNPDIYIQYSCTSQLLSYMDRNQDVGIVGPKLLNEDGSLQPSCRRYSTVATTFMRSLRLDLMFKKNYTVSRYLMEDYDHQEEKDVDWLTGAFMVIRRKAAIEIGYLDSQQFFMYAEDQDYCARMWMKNWRVVYFPDVSVNHLYLRQGVTNPMSINAYYQLKSTYRLLKKYNWKIRDVRR
jgi:GT2 family glycosyltransferase